MSSLSVIIICKNAEQTLHQCLSSVQWADEIIVLDSGSQDRSLAIARHFTSKVYSTDWPGFGQQKNRALSHATCDWVLSIDTDEWLSDELQQIIQSHLSQSKSDSLADAYYIERQSYYCGKLIRFGSWRHDWCLRLFKRDSAQFSNVPIHEKLICSGKTSKIKGLLFHNAYQNIDQVIEKMNRYSSIGAEMRIKQHKQSSLLKAIMRGAWTFFRDYCIKLGFLDGRAGFMLAISNAEGCYYRYVKLLHLNEISSKNIN